MKEITKTVAIAIAVISALKAAFDGALLFPVAEYAHRSILAAVFETAAAVCKDFLGTVLALSMATIMAWLFALLGKLIYGNKKCEGLNKCQGENSGASDSRRRKLRLVYAGTRQALSAVIERLEADGWIVDWACADTLEVRKRGSREQVPLPRVVIQELNSAGWKATYCGAQFMPPPWWVSKEPIQLRGYYRIERR